MSKVNSMNINAFSNVSISEYILESHVCICIYMYNNYNNYY